MAFQRAPHREVAWWALRCQLINASGYKLRYAMASFITADIRLKLQQVPNKATFSQGDKSWYPGLSQHLYRYGLERSSKQVFQDFVGRGVSAQALLTDMSRMRKTGL